LHANEGKNRFHGARAREEVAFKSPSKALCHDGSLSPGAKKNENPTRAQLAPNANDEVKRARLDRTQKHSIQTSALVFIQHLFRIIAVAPRESHLFYFAAGPKRPSSPRARKSPVGGGGGEHRGANGRPSRASRKRKLQKSNEDNSQFLKTLADGIV
jgi:hypothetical protein